LLFVGDTFSTFAPGTTPRVSTSRTSATLYPHQAHFVVGKILVGGKVSECAHAARPTHPRLPTAKLTCSNSHVGLCCKRIGGAATSKGSGKSLGHARQHTRQHAGQHAGHRVEPPLQCKLMPLQSKLILVNSFLSPSTVTAVFPQFMRPKICCHSENSRVESFGMIACGLY